MKLQFQHELKTVSSFTDIKSLRFKASKSPFPDGNVVLNIEPLKPTTSVLIKVPEGIQPHAVDMYCEGFGEVTEKKEYGQREYIVTFKDKESKSMLIKK